MLEFWNDNKALIVRKSAYCACNSSKDWDNVIQQSLLLMITTVTEALLLQCSGHIKGTVLW